MKACLPLKAANQQLRNAFTCRQAPDAQGTKEMRQKNHVSPVGHLVLGGILGVVADRRRCYAGAGADRGVKQRRAKGQDRTAIRAGALGEKQHWDSRAQALLDLPACLGDLKAAVALDENRAPERGEGAEKRPPPEL
jgi:hypothetical protein